jgi:hypothetical protein
MPTILFEYSIFSKLKRISSKLKRIFFKIKRYQQYSVRYKYLTSSPSEDLVRVFRELYFIELMLIENIKKEKLRSDIFRREFPKILWNWAIEQKVRVNRLHFYDTIISFIEGYHQYCDTGLTTSEANHSSRQLYCMTNGTFNEFWVSFYSLFFPKYLLLDQKGALRFSQSKEINNIVQEIRENGYHIFAQNLNSDICDRLVSFAENTLCKLFPYYPEISSEKYIRYDRSQPKSVTYRVDEQALAENPDIQNLIADLSIVSVVQEYLNCRVTLRDANMWWSTAFLGGVADSSSAQLYHWDGDAIKFINVFIYLTEVTSKNGPHCFIRYSHKSKPEKLLRDGRFSDKEIEGFYGKENIDELTGKKGTIIAADTRAFHKGKALESGERLILMLTFSVDLFGAPYSLLQLSDGLTDNLSSSIKHLPYTYSRCGIAFCK